MTWSLWPITVSSRQRSINLQKFCWHNVLRSKWHSRKFQRVAFWLDWGQLVALVEVEDDVLDVGLPHRLSGEHSFSDEEPQSYFWSMKSLCWKKTWRKVPQPCQPWPSWAVGSPAADVQTWNNDFFAFRCLVIMIACPEVFVFVFVHFDDDDYRVGWLRYLVRM